PPAARSSATRCLSTIPETGRRAMPVQILDITMPPSANHLGVPDLQADTEYDWEVLAIASGNQTIASSSFTTAD
ncbi:MAG: hypothetical protein ACRDO2_09140, partial [Nocardioidaceae bacterium]